MKKTLLFLLLIVFAVCRPSDERREERREEMRRRRLEHDRIIAECILNNNKTSPELKKAVEENKDNLIRAIHPRDHRIEGDDRDVIRDCRKMVFEMRKEELKKERERRHHEHDHDL